MSVADIVGGILLVLLLPTAFLYGNVYGRSKGLIFLLGAAAHMAVALVSVSGLALEPESDNLGFYLGAIEYLTPWRPLATGPSSSNWEYMISLVFRPFGESLLLGYAANQWIFFAALVQLLKFCRELGLNDKNQSRAILLMSFLPASLLYCNLLYRESFQVLCLIAMMRHLEIYRRMGTIGSLVKTALIGVPFGMIHNGFFLFVPIALVCGVFGRMLFKARQRSRGRGQDLAVFALGVVLVIGAVSVLSTFQDQRRITQIREGDIDVKELLTTAADIRGARTVFPWQPPPGITGTIIYAPIQLFQFLFAPVVPFMVGRAEDLVAVLEVAVRLLAFFMVFLAFKRGTREERRMILYLMGIYAMFCLLAAIGTTTVGTAMRHQLKVSWIPLSLGLLALQHRQRVPAPRQRPVQVAVSLRTPSPYRGGF